MCTHKVVLAAVCAFLISSAAFAESPNLGLPLAATSGHFDDLGPGTRHCKIKRFCEFPMLWNVLAFTAERNVSFLGQSRHYLIRSACPLMTHSRHCDSLMGAPWGTTTGRVGAANAKEVRFGLP